MLTIGYIFGVRLTLARGVDAMLACVVNETIKSGSPARRGTVASEERESKRRKERAIVGIRTTAVNSCRPGF